jgi:hypothetical protein
MQVNRRWCVHLLKREVFTGESKQSCQLAGVGEEDIVAKQLQIAL